MTYVTVDVDMSEFSDEEIKHEYARRNLGGAAENWSEYEELSKAYMLHHQGKKDMAYEILWKMCLIKLNKVV
ncbi:hypothetical protein UFOVP133_7 [uncultured Caudovirales phage]|uniref:Uncharacterized protein n=1 Tax=uncultured Caudovirales phage TaxID=2100421 RepID=A0A6J5LBD1_9CAUD|nr:hypothetical protein UFOVP133_7 [uncultured Caudovirales phage]